MKIVNGLLLMPPMAFVFSKAVVLASAAMLLILAALVSSAIDLTDPAIGKEVESSVLTSDVSTSLAALSD